MEHFFSLFSIFLAFGAGIGLARFHLVPPARIVNRLTAWALYLLLFFMGFRLGRNPEVAEKIGSVGLQSLLFAAAGVLGTIIIIAVLSIGDIRKAVKSRKHPPADTPHPSASVHAFIEPLILLAIVVFGYLGGLLLPVMPEVTGAAISSWVLWLLLFFIGIQLVQSGVNFRSALAHRKTIIIPIGTIIGTLAGGMVLSLFLVDLNWGRSLSVASGFGWYSLSGVLITDLGDPLLGSVAFLSNILRESMALVLIPFLGRTAVPHSSIGIAGATSMDVTLPVIERSCGPEVVPMSIAHGALLSVAVPILVPLFFQFG